ncbi:MAG: GNAT family N-acetyltransferase, partial [Calditrichia bacterium]|nr:GNAT family N-acetyltransferase [Calditrichia bacterium]
QVGFARIVTDYSLFAWICDIVIGPEHRSNGLGKKIMEIIETHPDIPKSLQLLKTKDAHKLYEKYGFVVDDCMSKRE